MTATSPVIAERLETLLLVRLSLPGRTPTALQLAKWTQRFAPTTLTPPAWRELVETTLADLQARQIIGPDRRLLNPDELQTRLGSHTAAKWDDWADRRLPALVLGIPVSDGKSRGVLSRESRWIPAIAGRVLDVWQKGSPPALAMVGSALVWRELGLPGAPEECPPAMRAHYLKLHITMSEGEADQLVSQIALREIKAPNSDTKTVCDALVRSWLIGNEPRPTAITALAAPTSPHSLISAARSAAQSAQSGVFGDRKVFISTVWTTLREHPPWAQLALDDFKRQLVAAHRAQQLVLTRADYVAAMDPALVAASETRTDGATFHFIERDPVR